jgi:hypothetical protein
MSKYFVGGKFSVYFQILCPLSHIGIMLEQIGFLQSGGDPRTGLAGPYSLPWETHIEAR